MFAFSCLQLISLSILLIGFSLVNSENQFDRNRRQAINSVQSKDSNVRSAGYYSSDLFKPPSLNGEKPVGWLDTKYSNWIQSRAGSTDQNEKVEGKNGSPESLLANVDLPQREDGGVSFLQKVAKQYVAQGEKSFNFAPYRGNQYRGTVCTNINSYNGYTFGQFPCPLPLQTGMNQFDRFCCGPSNAQFCCNEREYQHYQQILSGGRHRDSKSHLYPPQQNYVVPIVVPIVGTLVGIIAIIIVVLYYKRTKNDRSSLKSSAGRLNDQYESVPQDSTVDRPLPPPRPNSNSQSNA